MFIEINKELSVETDSIEAIEMVNDGNSLIYTASRSFKVAMSKRALIALIYSRKMNMYQEQNPYAATPRP